MEVPSSGRHPVELSRMRVAIGRRMLESKQGAPHFYVTSDIEMDRVIAAAAVLNEARSPEERITLTAFIVKAAALALKEHPDFNAVWDESTLQLVDAVNVGVAIALDDGLTAPAILDCGARDIAGISAALRDLVGRARTGRLRPAELTEGTFTVSNLGMYDIATFAAIITPPQVAILAVGRTEPRAVVREGAVVIRQMLSATLSADHRAVDGVGAARFLTALRARLEEPDPWVKA